MDLLAILDLVLKFLIVPILAYVIKIEKNITEFDLRIKRLEDVFNNSDCLASACGCLGARVRYGKK